jgi:hypothetical protein
MTGATLLLRQIHPSFVQAGNVTSQAFRPTPKDQKLLSAYDGDSVDPQSAWRHYTTVWKLDSVGVMALTCDECACEKLPSRPDPQSDCPEHGTKAGAVLEVLLLAEEVVVAGVARRDPQRWSTQFSAAKRIRAKHSLH